VPSDDRAECYRVERLLDEFVASMSMGRDRDGGDVGPAGRPCDPDHFADHRETVVGHRGVSHGNVRAQCREDVARFLDRLGGRDERAAAFQRSAEHLAAVIDVLDGEYVNAFKVTVD
jgi:hypothetical protein